VLIQNSSKNAANYKDKEMNKSSDSSSVPSRRTERCQQLVTTTTADGDRQAGSKRPEKELEREKPRQTD